MDYVSLAKEIRKQLNFAHQEFSKQIKKDTNISNNYKNIGHLYREIVKHLENISRLPTEFKFYKIAAELGFIQCKVNSFQLCPLKESTIKKNDRQLASFAEQIQQIEINE